MPPSLGNTIRPSPPSQRLPPRSCASDFPTSSELVYDNYNALAIGFGPTERASDAVFSIAVYPRWVSLFFLQGNGLRDAGRILKGAGKKARHIVLTSADDLHDERVVALMNEALARTIAARHPAVSYRMIIKSISAKQRPRRSQDDEHAISSAGAERRSNEPPKKKAAVRSQKTVSRGKPPAKPAQRAKSQSPSR